VDLVTINITSKESVNLVCSKCGNARRIVTSKLTHVGRIYKVKCACTHGFSIQFERRKYKRKKLKFIGTYSTEHNLTDHIIDIVDLSRGGLAFTRTDSNKLMLGDKINIRFNLDNPEQDLIECTVLIRNVFDSRVCVEFLDMRGRMHTTLGFYFL